MQEVARPRSSFGAISFRNRGFFWAGVAAVTAGVALHIPMYVNAAVDRVPRDPALSR